MHESKVFELVAERSGGGTAYMWILSQPDGYYLHSLERGQLSGPCVEPVDTLRIDGTEFAWSILDITCSLTSTEFDAIVGVSFLFGSIEHLTVNGESVPPTSREVVGSFYRASLGDVVPGGAGPIGRSMANEIVRGLAISDLELEVIDGDRWPEGSTLPVVYCMPNGFPRGCWIAYMHQPPPLGILMVGGDTVAVIRKSDGDVLFYGRTGE
jgi:hypothetical protein